MGFFMKHINDVYTLYNGVEIPCVAYGTYKAAEGNGSEAIFSAIEEGYRYFDTASFYETEEYLAEAIRRSGLPREDFFIATKLWKTEMGYENALKAFEESCKRLETDYIDLYLIHWPKPTPDYEDWKQLDIDTWRALEKLYKEGKVRAIGLSNFLPHHLDNILENCEIKPMVDQLEYHAGYTQEVAVQYCKQHGIIVQAWSPISRGRIFHDETLIELSKKYDVSIAQLCLRFCVQNGVIPLPKASSKERMRENKDIFNFEISDEDMKRILTIPQVGWSGEHPDRERVPVV
jgi:diketogulonate reductase-like aldo/keto reductase